MATQQLDKIRKLRRSLRSKLLMESLEQRRLFDAEFLWTGAVDNDWENDGNWSWQSGTHVDWHPGAADTAIFDTNATIVLAGNIDVANLVVTDGCGVTINLGSYVMSVAENVEVNNSATLTLYDSYSFGEFYALSTYLGGDRNGPGEEGTMTVQGYTVFTCDDLYLQSGDIDTPTPSVLNLQNLSSAYFDVIYFGSDSPPSFGYIDVGPSASFYADESVSSSYDFDSPYVSYIQGSGDFEIHVPSSGHPNFKGGLTSASDLDLAAGFGFNLDSGAIFMGLFGFTSVGGSIADVNIFTTFQSHFFWIVLGGTISGGFNDYTWGDPLDGTGFDLSNLPTANNHWRLNYNGSGLYLEDS